MSGDNRFGILDYDNCLVNLSNSILKRFGVETTADTLPAADEYLSHGHKNVVLLLLDAMGTSILEKHLEEDGFFRSHVKTTYYSVYPPTTVAATTSVLSGLYPNEHGWLGWDMFYPELGKNVTVFTNNEQATEKDGAEPVDGKWTCESLNEFRPAAEFHAGYKYTPYKNIMTKINESGGTAYASMPFLEPFPDTLEKIIARIKDLCTQPGEKFIYAYWNEPDTTMHLTGTVSKETHDMVASLEDTITELASSLSDTLLIITADHSHMDSRNYCILDYPEVLDCLKLMPSIEPRTLNFFVKEEYIDSFPEIFRKNFGDDFLLLTREEVIRDRLFGTGKDHPGLKDMIGDYVALSLNSATIFTTHLEAQEMIGGHAGMTAEEVMIPLIVVEKDS